MLKNDFQSMVLQVILLQCVTFCFFVINKQCLSENYIFCYKIDPIFQCIKVT